MKRPEVRPGFVLTLCLLYYISPWRLFVSFLCCALAHELGHLLALRLLGVRIEGIVLGAFGAVMDTGPMTPFCEAICALSGPAVNMALFFLLCRRWPAAALVSLLLGCYNLLPVFPLDGGRALRAMLCAMLPQRAAYLAELVISALCAAFLGCLAVYAGRSFALAPSVLFAAVLSHLCFERITCCHFAAQPI